MAPITDSSTFLQRPISIEAEESQNRHNWSVVTLTSQTNEPNYMRNLEDCAKGLCAWINSQLEREADCNLENNQIICEINIRREYLAEDVIPELKRRLETQGRAMMAGAGGNSPGNGITTGEEDYERIRGA